MTAPLFGAITVFLIALVTWVYRQVREAHCILGELKAVEEQSQRELQRARRLLALFNERSPEALASEHFSESMSPNIMSRQTIQILGDKLVGQPDNESVEIRGLRKDITATVGRLNSLQEIEKQWHEHLSKRARRPALRLLLKLNGVDI